MVEQTQTEKKKERRPYTKPMVAMVQLRPREVLGGSCKSISHVGPGDVTKGFGCYPLKICQI
jgi:hypothetical protein